MRSLTWSTGNGDLEGHHPDRLTPDTSTDSRKGQLQYTESDFMDIEEKDGKPAALPEWKRVESRKNKASTNTAKAIATPLPVSPRHKISIPTAKGLIPTTPTNDTTTFASASVVREPGDFDQPQYSHVNDGTLRITAKLKPQNYEQLFKDQCKWNLTATDMIHYMFQTSQDVTLIPGQMKHQAEPSQSYISTQSICSGSLLLRSLHSHQSKFSSSLSESA